MLVLRSRDEYRCLREQIVHLLEAATRGLGVEGPDKQGAKGDIKSERWALKDTRQRFRILRMTADCENEIISPVNLRECNGCYFSDHAG